jgi:GMP synthase (glutamine-hydrolysing)
MRNPDDPMRTNEVNAFSRALAVSPDQIRTVDLLSGVPSEELFPQTDVFLLGGSGHYSATDDGDWLVPILQLLRDIYDAAKPTFASCWGFQAMARAMGGRVIRDPKHAELGTQPLQLTEAGRTDPVFGPLGDTFSAHMGHEDRVVDLPPGAILLASTDVVANQAYRFDGLPIYCTQFHPELNRDDMVARLGTYSEYVERIAGIALEQFLRQLGDTPDTEQILRRFLNMVLGD